MDDTTRAALLSWFRERKRDLPWRRSRDPYAIWVSEVMSQQTRMETVVGYHARWMAAFPTVADLAAADEEDVMQHWQGLGYYSRARNLHRAARVVVRDHGGRLPETAAGLRGLPGIGDYTAGAVASIAYGEPVPAVDGNVVRVMARLTGEARDVGRAPAARAIRAAAASWVDQDRPGDWNQAVMDLGAAVCTPCPPDCGACPLRPACVAHREGTVAKIPRKKAKKRPLAVAMRFAVVQEGGRVLLVKNPEGGLLAGLWGLPGGPVDVPLGDLVRDQAGVQVRPEEDGVAVRHVFTHRVWRMQVHHAEPLDSEGSGDRPVRWHPVQGLDAVPLSEAARKALRSAGLDA